MEQGLEVARRVVQAADLLRLQIVLRLLMSGRPMGAINEYADIHRASKHPHFKPQRWNER
jgi:hypothetical protein